MPLKRYYFCFIMAIFLLFALVGIQSTYADSFNIPLTLPEAEHLALITSPELQRLKANSQSLDEQAIADDQLPDPKLMVGVINVPTNTFSFSQDDMTMKEVGLQQSFPPGHSLRIKSEQTKDMAEAESRQKREQTLMLLRNVRDSWLDLYYWIHAKQIIHSNRILLSYLVKTATSQYSVGKVNQSDVLQAQVALTQLDDQSVQIDQQIAMSRAQLGRWIGQNKANFPLASQLPHWSSPPPLANLQTILQQHPMLKVDAAKIQAGREEVAYMKEQYKPGVMVDVDYGVRQGNMMNSERRSDMVGAQVTVDLPVFTGQRQDRRLKSSTYQLLSTQLEQQTHYRDLSETLASQYASWQELGHRELLLKKHLNPEARQNSKAALIAYQNATTDIIPVLRAYTSRLDIEQQTLQVEIARLKARAALLYLQGD